MFSPYYAWAGRTEPEDHCAVNVAVYRPSGSRWSMTERGRGSISRETNHYTVGPSALTWDGNGLTIEIAERAVPHLTAIRGTVRLVPEAINPRAFELDEAGRHSWRPIAPTARVEVNLSDPAMRWSGHGYLDSNWGSEPLENAFVRWDWSRADMKDGAAILYDAERRFGDNKPLALKFDRQGRVEEMKPPPRVSLPSGLWRVRRGTQADTTDGVTIRKVLEDTPFYTREVLDTRLFGERVEAVHESLDLDRFAATWVRLLLPFRMPRIRGRSTG